MKFIVLALGLTSFASFAAEIKVPAASLLAASRTIVSQSAPFYSTEGKIKCEVINTGWAPMTSSCFITVQGKTVKVSNANSIIDAVRAVKPATGPVYKFSGTFKASSMSSELPPYGVKEKATVNVK